MRARSPSSGHGIRVAEGSREKLNPAQGPHGSAALRGGDRAALLTGASACAVMLLSALAAMFLGVSASAALRFAAFQIFLLFLPGAALSALLLRERETGPLGFVFVSYALGYALNMIEYFAVAAIGLTETAAASLCISASAVVVFAVLTGIRRKVGNGQSALMKVRGFKKKDIPHLVLFILFYIVVFFGYSARYTVPSVSEPVKSYHADALFWVENAASLKKAFPPEEFRLSGTPLFYHYFASAWVALAGLVTKADTFSLSYALYPFGKCLLLFGGLYCAAHVWFERERERLLLLLILLFTTGFERYSCINYTAHIVTLPFGFDIALAYGAYFLAGLYLQYREERFSIPVCAMTAAAFLTCAGHKAPLALVLLVFAGVLCLHWLAGGLRADGPAAKAQIGKAFSNGVSALVCFTAVMVVCVGFLTGSESRVNAGKFSHCGLLAASPLYEEYRAAALSGVSGLKKLAAYLGAMVKLVFSIHPLIMLLVIMGIVVLIVRRKGDFIDLALLLTFAAGMCMGLFNAQEGVSQMYYCMAAFIPGVLFGLRSCTYIGDKRTKLFWPVLAVLLLLTGSRFALRTGLPAEISGGKQSSASEITESDRVSGRCFCLPDYEALVWVRDNTPRDAVIVTDRSVLTDTDNYMYYGAFSERANYIEGDRYFYGTYVAERAARRETVRALYANDPSSIETMRDAGVSYVIRTKSLAPDYEGPGTEKVFETDTVDVWKIK